MGDTAVNSSAHAVLGYLHSFLSRHRGEQDHDRELLHRFVESRDGDAFALLMRRHGLMVLGLARRILGDAHLASSVHAAKPDESAGWVLGRMIDTPKASRDDADRRYPSPRISPRL